MKFEVGKDYETRDKSKRRLVAIRSDGAIVSLPFDDGEVAIFGGLTHNQEGRAFGSSSQDLISEWVEPAKPMEGWFIASNRILCGPYDSREYAAEWMESGARVVLFREVME